MEVWWWCQKNRFEVNTGSNLRNVKKSFPNEVWKKFVNGGWLFSFVRSSWRPEFTCFNLNFAYWWIQGKSSKCSVIKGPWTPSQKLSDSNGCFLDHVLIRRKWLLLFLSQSNHLLLNYLQKWKKIFVELNNSPRS